MTGKNKVFTFFTIFAYSLQKTRFPRFSLKAFKRSAKSSQNDPRSVPRDPKSGLGGAKSGPGEPQERPGRGPGATPEAPWKRFWSLKGLIRELLGTPRDLIFKLLRCCPRTLRLLPLCPSNDGSAGARASVYNFPKMLTKVHKQNTTFR